MKEKRVIENKGPYDVIVIGAGICGIIFLKYASEKGLRCLALEKKDAIGGLWNRIPAWQEIQNRKADFAIDGVPLDGVKQPDVIRHMQKWVQEYDLTRFIRLQHEVTSVSRMNGEWQVKTNRGTFRTHYLIAASGVQNDPWIPEVERLYPEVTEIHSSILQKPEDLAERRVTVVGGGASALDLLDLALENNAKEIQWIYRNTRWFWPTSGSKQTLWPNLRELSIMQTVTGSTRMVNAFLRWMLKKLYKYFKITEIMPPEGFDISKHQIIPGRSSVIRNFSRISHHQTKIRRIQGHEIRLENGDHFDTDIILWGTGYKMNLKYLGLPEYSRINTLEQLRPRLGSLFVRWIIRNLFFIGMSLIDGSGSTPFFTAIEAKSIVAHIMGQCEIPGENIPHLIVHWDLFKYFASFDHVNYPGIWWRIKYFLLVWWYAVLQNRHYNV